MQRIRNNPLYVELTDELNDKLKTVCKATFSDKSTFVRQAIAEKIVKVETEFPQLIEQVREQAQAA